MKGAYRALSIVLVSSVICSAFALGGGIGWFGMESIDTYYANKSLTQTAYPTSTMTFTPSPTATFVPTATLTPYQQLMSSGILGTIPLEENTPFSDITRLLSRYNENIRTIPNSANYSPEERFYYLLSDITAFLDCQNRAEFCYYPFFINYTDVYNNDISFKSQVDQLPINPSLLQVLQVNRFYEDISAANSAK